MNYAKLNKTDIANGSGVRVSLFVSGCTRHCKGCFNPEAWDFDYGQEFTPDTLREILDALKPDHIAGLTILGGEPLEEKNYATVKAIARLVKKRYPNKTIWLYTGYVYEDVREWSLMDLVDILVDGEFVEELKDITLRFRGSKNQRIIDVKKSRKADSVVLWEG